MSGYHGRRGPNVSQYVADLNTVPAQHDFVPDPLGAETDFSAFTKDFIDWDAGAAEFDPRSSTLDLNGLDIEQPPATQARSNGSTRNTGPPKMEDFTLDGDFQFADFSNFQDPIVNLPIQPLPQSQPGAYPGQHSYTSPVSTSVSPVVPTFDQSDEAARNAAEEDKRRRNTAASARFRIKKKQREQALEKTAKEMSDRVNVLETRIKQLETENDWLKSLITEKNVGTKTTADISALMKLKKHVEVNAIERSTGGRTDGVGTESTEDEA